MPPRRDAIRMTPQEVQAYLQVQNRIIVVTNGSNGLPHPMPMHYGLDERGRILITTFAKSQKVRNLERDPRATLLIESGSIYRELKSVILYCDAQIVIDPNAVEKLMRLVKAPEEMAHSMNDSMRRQVRSSVPKRVVVCFTPFYTVSWDHSKLAGQY